MANGKNDPGTGGPGDFKPDEFEDVELPSEVPEGGEDEETFETVDLSMFAPGTPIPMETLLAAKEQLERKLILDVQEQALAAESGTDMHGFENIKGVGISEKIVAGWLSSQLCITVYVAAKVSIDEVLPAAQVPKEVNGIATDVVEIGEIEAFPFKGRYRPALGGVSVGHFRITAGTIGCLVTKGHALFILSNNHVLANVNRASIGDPILQPGPFDGGRVPADVIAKLSEYIPINFAAPNEVDCAIAQTSPSLVTPGNKCFAVGSPHQRCRLNLLVRKCGRTTQFTRGRITDCNATVRVGYGPAGTAVFRNQIIIQSLTAGPFSRPGDSGSLIVTDRRRPVGLLFAGSASHTVANPITAVLAALDVRIV